MLKYSKLLVISIISSLALPVLSGATLAQASPGERQEVRQERRENRQERREDRREARHERREERRERRRDRREDRRERRKDRREDRREDRRDDRPGVIGNSPLEQTPSNSGTPPAAAETPAQQ